MPLEALFGSQVPPPNLSDKDYQEWDKKGAKAVNNSQEYGSCKSAPSSLMRLLLDANDR